MLVYEKELSELIYGQESKWVDIKKNLKQSELIQNKWNNMGWHKKKFKKVVNLWKGTKFVYWIKGNKRVDWRK